MKPDDLSGARGPRAVIWEFATWESRHYVDVSDSENPRWKRVPPLKQDRTTKPYMTDGGWLAVWSVQALPHPDGSRRSDDRVTEDRLPRVGEQLHVRWPFRVIASSPILSARRVSPDEVQP